MKTTDFDYHLPRHFIAQTPCQKRDRSKLLVLHRATGKTEHRRFGKILESLNQGDLIVLNNTKVLPAKLIGRRRTGGLIELLLVKEIKPGVWEILFNTRGKIQPNEPVIFNRKTISGKLVKKDTQWLIRFNEKDILPLLEETGKAPLPPYIKRSKTADPYLKLDKERYQTVYASEAGAIAAPTAGLHFTFELLNKIRAKGIKVIYIALHIGQGTFKPVVSQTIAKHRMDSEFFEVKPEAILSLIQARQRNRRVIAVGTTVCRTLETIADYITSARHPLDTQLIARTHLLRGWTDLFIHPPYKFKLVSALITNFHLPRGTPLMLTCAFAGREKVFRAYQEAIKHNYRFYSYGDAMAIF